MKLPEGKFCVGDFEKDDKAAHCYLNDFGAPLVIGEKLVGIVSWSCKISGYPGVYTDVSHYNSWIMNKTEILKNPSR